MRSEFCSLFCGTPLSVCRERRAMLLRIQTSAHPVLSVTVKVVWRWLPVVVKAHSALGELCLG